MQKTLQNSTKNTSHTYLLISDTHFGHKNIQKYCDRPEDWEDKIIKNWAEKSHLYPKDEVTTIHLGDFIFGSNEDGAEILSKVNGQKILIRGNHDRKSSTDYMHLGFDIVLQTMQMANILFSHYPVDIVLASKALGRKLDLNIHGHFHNNPSKQNFDLKRFKQKYPFYGKNHRLFALEYTNYQPVELSEFIHDSKTNNKLI